MSKMFETPVLVPIEVAEFWEQIRVIIREEVGKLLKDRQVESTLDTPQGLTEKPLYTIAEVCKLFTITRPTMYEWIKDGKLKPKKIRGKVFFIGVDIQQLIQIIGTENKKRAA